MNRPETLTVTLSLLEWRVILDALAQANTDANHDDKDTAPRGWAADSILAKYAYACLPTHDRYKNVSIETLKQLKIIHPYDYETNDYYKENTSE